MGRRCVAAAIVGIFAVGMLLSSCGSAEPSPGSTPSAPTAELTTRPDGAQSMDDGFPTGLGVESEAVLVEALAMYHLERSDAECVAHQAFVDEAPDRTYGDAYTLTADELNAAAAACRIDFSALWYTND